MDVGGSNPVSLDGREVEKITPYPRDTTLEPYLSKYDVLPAPLCWSGWDRGTGGREGGREGERGGRGLVLSESPESLFFVFLMRGKVTSRL